MADFHEVIQYYDALQRGQVDDRLYMIMDEHEHPYRTTENTVYARDPLQPISKIMDALKVVPTVPVSNSVEIIGGHFYCGGQIYVFPGARSVEIVIHPYIATQIFVGLRVNKNTGEVTPWVNTEYGVIPSYFPEVIPLALITKRPDTEEFLSDDILDIRPFQNFDVAIPKDKREIEILCLGPNEGIAFSRRPFIGGAPFLQVWQRIGKAAPSYDILHDFRHSEDSLDAWYDFRPFTGLYNPEYLTYDPAMDGVSLKKHNRRASIELPALPSVVFVSKLGRDTWPGTKDQPVATLKQALSIFNALPEKTTIWLGTGEYITTTALTFSRDVTIIGQDPTNTHIRFASRGKLRCEGELQFRTTGLQFYGQIQEPDTYNAWVHSESLSLYNCVGTIFHEASICAPFFSAVSSLFFTNCVFQNRFPALDTTARIVDPAVPLPSFQGFQNLIYLGNWVAMLGISGVGSTSIHDAVTDPLFIANDGTFRPRQDSPCIDTGTAALVGVDLDGTLTDIGIYGGRFASMADNPAYPINQAAIFKWPVQTMFGSLIEKFEQITSVITQPADTKVQAIVSFTGGKTWLTWHEERAAWRVILFEQALSLAKSWEYTRERLLETDLSEYTEEVIIAFVLSTAHDQKAPAVSWVNFKCTFAPDTLSLYPMDQLDIFVNDTSAFIRNRLPGKVRNLVVVLR